MTKKLARDHQEFINNAGDLVSTLDLGNEYVTWNHNHGIEIGRTGDAENARLMIDG